MTKTKNSWFIIVNPHAGSGKTMKEWPVGQSRLDELGVNYNAVLTSHRAHATTLACFAASKGYRRILGVGGDGTIHEIFNGILKWCEENGADPSEFYLGVAPIGSGNDWIKAFDIEKDVVTVADLMAKESFGQEDVVKVELADDKVCYMANIGGLGFDSHVCEIVNRQKAAGRRNKMIYANALRRTIFSLRSINLQVLADGEEVHNGPCLSIALGNGRYSGSGMCQVPLAEINDGIIDVMIVPKLPLKILLKEVKRIFGHNVHESEYIKYVRCKTLEILPLDARSKDIVEVDGEVEGMLPARISVTGQKVNALTW